MLCECGCGQTTPIATRTQTSRGVVKGQPLRFIKGHNKRTATTGTVCVVDGCDRVQESRGLCHAHAQYERRRGVVPDGPVLSTTAERFWAKVERQDGRCWLWTGATDGGGRYGTFRGENGQVRAHRWAYESEHGPIPDGLDLDHLCRVTLCVNPAHLEPVSHRTNVLRGDAPTAVNAAKTECAHGHPLAGDNLIVERNGTRDCRTCRRDRTREAQRRYRARKRAR